MVAPREPEPWIDATKVAEHIGVTRAYVLRLALLRQIPATELPTRAGGARRRWRFRLSEVERWMQTRHTGANA